MVRASILLGLCLLAAGLSQAGEEAGDGTILRFAPGRGTDTLSVGPGQRRICLRHSPLLLGTAAVTRNGVSLLEGTHYRVDADEGCLEFFTASPESARLVVHYRYLPITARLQYQLHRPMPLDAEATPEIPEAFDDGADAGGKLIVGGSKTFVVELGSNRDAVLRQGLDLSVRGRLSRNVDLEAVLSDRDSPVTPEGTSSELEELDKVFIRVTSPEVEATFGDIAVSQPTGQFARYERQLEGVWVKRPEGRLRLGGLAANARGMYRTAEFFGVEGKQGPYRLADAVGGATLGVVPGSEEVYLDGEKLRRGQDRDYTIDYAVGEISFTPRRPISFDSRITVDVEVQNEEYRRQFLGGEAGYEDPSGLWRTRAIFFAEQDDRTAPRGFSIDDEEREILESVGDDDPIGETFAATNVGAGNGDYVKVAADSLAPAHFDWVGMGIGDWRVSFIRVGSGLGAYRDSTLSDGSVAYIFVGSGIGDFEPGRSLSRPESHTISDVQFDLDSERLTLSGELAVSALDRNTFSSRDDSDNEGIAGRGEMALRGMTWASGAGGVELFGRWRSVDADFVPLSRINESFDFLSWGYDPSGLDAGDDRGLVGVTLRPGDGGELSIETGRLRSGAMFSADRAAARYQRGGRVTTRLSLERTWSERPTDAITGYREVRAGVVSGAFGIVHPTLRHRHELTRATGDSLISGNRFESWMIETALRPHGPLALHADFEHRVDDSRDDESRGDWHRSSTTRDRGARLELSRWRGILGSAVYRLRNLESETVGDSRETDLARLNLEALPAAGALRLIVDYQVTTEAVLPREKEITFVGDGRGNYDSLGVFVGTGDYDVDIVQSGETELLSRMDLSFRANLLGRSEATAPAFWRLVRATTFGRLRQASRLAFERLLNPFDASLYSTSRSTVEGALTLRQELSMFPSARVSPGVRWERFRHVDGRFANVRDRREEDVVALRVRSTPRSRWTVILEGTAEETRDVVERLDPEYAREAEEYSSRDATGEVIFQPSPPWTMSMEGVTGRTERTGDDEIETRVELSPRLTWAPGRLGRIEGRLRWVDVRTPLSRRRPVFGFGIGHASGVEWSLVADYRMRETMTVAGTLQASRPRGGETLYDGRMELRAYF